MFFRSLFMRFSFFRNRVKRKLKETLETLHLKVETQGAFVEEDIIALHSIVNASVISFNEELVLGTMANVKFFTNTSMKAINALSKREVMTVNLAKSRDIELVSNPRPFDEWYSNQTSVEEFVSAMALRLEQQAILYSTATKEVPDGDLLRYNLTPVWNTDTRQIDFHQLFPLTEEDSDLFESQLYRILLLDLIGILRFYVDHQL